MVRACLHRSGKCSSGDPAAMRSARAGGRCHGEIVVVRSLKAQWGCSGRCVLAMVQSAVRRELGDGVASSPAPHRHRVPLGSGDAGAGMDYASATAKGAGGATRERRGTNRRLADERVRAGGRSRSCAGLSMQWGCPVLTTEGFSPEAMALVMPKVFVERFGVASAARGGVEDSVLRLRRSAGCFQPHLR